MNKWYPWLTAPYRQLVELYSSDRSHHALLLHSSTECGVALLVNALGRRLMCQHLQGEKICGTCHGCRLMAAGNHPDWHVLEAEANKTTIGVELVRQLTETLYHHAQQGGVKAVWIPQAELLGEAAANALLKTLEEPPQNTYFLVGCRETSQLLATIRSRCLYWHLPLPAENYSVEWLNRQNASRPEMLLTALRLSNGSPLDALNLLEKDRWQQRAELYRTFAVSCQNRDFLGLLPVLNDANAVEKLAWVSSLWLDAAKYKLGVRQQIVNQDSLALIESLAQGILLTVLQNYCQEWLNCRQQLLSVAGINQELMLINLLCQIQRQF